MKKITTGILFILFSSIYIHAQVGPPLVCEITSDSVMNQEIDTAHRQVLEDKEGRWTIDEVNRPPLAGKFQYSGIIQPHPNKIINAYWFRYRLKNKMENEWTFLLSGQNETADFYLLRQDGKWQHLVSGFFSEWEKKDGFKAANYVQINIKANEVITVYQRIGNSSFSRNSGLGFNIAFSNTNRMLKEVYADTVDKKIFMFPLDDLQGAFFIGFLFFAAFFNSFFYAVSRERMFLYFTLFVLLSAIHRFQPVLYNLLAWGYKDLRHYRTITQFSWAFSFIFLFLFFRQAFKVPVHYRKWDKVLIGIFSIYGLITLARVLAGAFLLSSYEKPLYTLFMLIEVTCMEALFITLLLYIPRKDQITRQVLLGGMPIIFLWSVVTLFSSNSLLASFNILPNIKNLLDNNIDLMQLVCIVWFILFFSWFLFMRFNMLKRESAQKSLDNERLAKEKEIERNELISKQNAELEKKVEERTLELKHSLQDLKLSQAQLIQSEKMASLGELTAGIAHEIQNPLNFVNNFSEVNKELLMELKDEMKKGNLDEVNAIADDVISNEEKINHHGKRADAIVKGMLQHSRSSSGVKEPTNINSLADEYLRLAYHGLRAKDKTFNATLKTDFDETIGNINIIPQDIGRVILNLITNAFYVVDEKKKQIGEDFEPTVSVSTKKINDKVEIKVSDNGNGIPQKVLDKIFQPFFTTKPTGQGTGLGLSLSYDIVKAHGGELKVETKENESTVFTIVLPIQALYGSD
ncbi:MAG: ATP-binding protein [Lacibacter sp.]